MELSKGQVEISKGQVTLSESKAELTPAHVVLLKSLYLAARGKGWQLTDEQLRSVPGARRAIQDAGLVPVAVAPCADDSPAPAPARASALAVAHYAVLLSIAYSVRQPHGLGAREERGVVAGGALHWLRDAVRSDRLQALASAPVPECTS